MIKVLTLKDINKSLEEGAEPFEIEPNKIRKFETQLNAIKTWGEENGYELMTFYFYEQMNFVFNNTNKLMKTGPFSD